jgi:predicted permease
MHTLWQDIRYGVRMWLKTPGFSAVAILTLALGIGLNASIFSVVNALLFTPLPVRAPAELVGVYNLAPGNFISHEPLAYPDYKDLRDASSSFDGLAGYALMPLALDRGDQSELVMGEIVTGNYFSMLGVPMARGRAFQDEEDRVPGADPFAVLSYGTWQQRFGADPNIVGKTIRLNGNVFTVVGVAPQEFHGLFRGLAPEMWVPMMMTGTLRPDDRERLENRDSRWMSVMGRLKPGVAIQKADAELRAIGTRLQQEYPKTNRTREVGILPASEVKVFPGVDRVLTIASAVLMTLVGLVLMIACVNVANMMLARAASRRREIAVRLALGANRSRLSRQLLTESLLLALPGGALGLLFVLWSNRALNSFQLPLPIKLSLGLAIDARVVAFTLGVSVLTIVLFGLAPALQASRADLATALKDDSAAATGGRAKRRLANALVVAQVALSLLLLIGAGLSARSMMNAARIDPGFVASGVVDAEFDVALRGYSSAEGASFYHRLVESVRQLPGVQSAGYGSHAPLSFTIRDTRMAPEGREADDEKKWPEVDTATVGPGYFETLRIPVVRGRTFTEQDTPQAPSVVVINEALAQQFWPGENAMSKRIRLAGEKAFYQVAGIVRNGKYRTLGESPRPYLYKPITQNYESSQMLFVRAAGDPGALMVAIRAEAKRLDERIALTRLQTLTETTSTSLLLPRMGAVVFGLFGLLGLVLASVGIYGVISFSTSQRTQEIGIRMALGADRGQILRLVIGHGLTLTMIGLALGLVGALALTRTLALVLYGISPTDAATFAGVSLVFLMIATLAAYLPARRATRVDPLRALRYQ